MYKELEESYLTALELYYSYNHEKVLPLNRNVPKNQLIFKDLYQNMVEETSEFLELYYELDQKERNKNSTAILDEVADISNFVHVMMALFREEVPDFSINEAQKEASNVGFNGEDYINMNHISASYIVANMVYNFGMVCNLLKNRPWKQNQYFVNRSTLYKRLDKSYNSYKLFLSALQIDRETFKNAIKRKSDVNKFRIKTNY
jgi:hypothetical protein